MRAVTTRPSIAPLVLILAEEPAYLRFLHDVLGSDGYRVVSRCWDAFDREELTVLHPTLLMVEAEIVTRRPECWELLRDLSDGRIVPTLPTLVLSTDPCALDRARELDGDPPCWRYLAMPFDLEECLAAVVGLTGRVR